jgi:tRNA(Ile)-lysidine synthase
LIDHRTLCTQDGDLQYTWFGETEKYLPSLKGTLIFKESKTGVSSEFLKQTQMTIRQRQKGARLRLAKNRPSRDLKSHFQTAKIPFWQRENLPYIYINEQLFFVGLLGLDARFIETDEQIKGGIRLQLIWQPDT